MTTDRPVTLAVIIGAHGIAGEVRLKLFTDDLKPYPVLSALDYFPEDFGAPAPIKEAAE